MDVFRKDKIKEKNTQWGGGRGQCLQSVSSKRNGCTGHIISNKTFFAKILNASLLKYSFEAI